MEWKILCSVLILNIISIMGQTTTPTATAYFNMAGLTGNVEFRRLTNTQTRATVNIEATRWFQWEIREFPVKTTDSLNCDDSSLGRRVHSLSNFLNVIDSRTRQGTRVDLRGVSLEEGNNAIVGRSLLLRNGRERACATIQGSEPLSFAILNGHIAGNVQVRPVGRRYAIFTELFSTRSLTPSQSKMSIYSGEILSDQPNANRERISVTERCQNQRASSATLIAEIQSVPVSGGNFRTSSRSMQYITPNSAFNFQNGWFRIGEVNDVSCANFHRYEPKIVQAKFSRAGVSGEISFKQDDPYKPTNISVNLKGLNRNGGDYHVYNFPVPYQYTSRTDLCGPQSTGERFNPLNTTRLRGTQDRQEIGDLSSKHGSLANRDSVNQRYLDLYLPLFGEYSIVGRSLVIHSRDGQRWACANIGYPGKVTVAEAEFNGDVEGTVTFVQQEDKPWGDTSIVIEMADSGRTTETTLNHNYYIHNNPVGNDHLATTRRCASTGARWNPYNVASANTAVYKPTCEANRLGCEAGDLTSRHKSTINIQPSFNSTKYFYTDTIPLSGAYSIIRKSVTINRGNAAAIRYVCADILQKLSPVVRTADQWQGIDNRDRVTGAVQMFSSGLDSHVTRLRVNVEGLNRKAGDYHIYQYPLNTKQQSTSNACDTTGAIYNPLGATNKRRGNTLESYAIGDLSTKFGMLTNRNRYDLEELDTNLPLSGINSVMGRSVVIRDSATRWKCTNTVWDSNAMNGTLLQARATFNSGIEGHITFTQVASLDGHTDVNIEVMLSNGNRSRQASMDHNWHIHFNSLSDQDCNSAAGHYNPFNKDVNSISYQQQCKPEASRKCEVGDLAGKLGKLNIGAPNNSARYIYNDDFLSLTGKFSVMGRSVVIHDQNSGAPRIACADIVPFGPATESVQYFIKTPGISFKNKMTTAVINELKLNEHWRNIYVQIGAQRGPCTVITVIFTGHNATALRQLFDLNSIKSRDYRPVQVNSCSNTSPVIGGNRSGGKAMLERVSGALILLMLTFTSFIH